MIDPSAVQAAFVEAYISSSTNVNNKYTLYELIVVSVLVPDRTCYSIHKRYSDFYKLHTRLKKYVKELPVFPEKRWNKMDQTVIYERTCKLNFYVKYLCTLVKSGTLSGKGQDVVLDFLRKHDK